MLVTENDPRGRSLEGQLSKEHVALLGADGLGFSKANGESSSRILDSCQSR